MFNVSFLVVLTHSEPLCCVFVVHVLVKTICNEFIFYNTVRVNIEY